MEILTSIGEWKFNSVTIQYSLSGISVVCGMSITPGCGVIDVGRMLQSCPPIQSSGFSYKKKYDKYLCFVMYNYD